MGSVVEGAIRNYVQEELGPGVEDFVQGADLTWNKISMQMMGVQRDGIGRDWVYITNLNLGTAGAVHWDTALEGTESGGTHQVQRSAMPTYPSSSEYLSANSAQIKVRLVKMRGSLFMPTSIMEIDRLSAAQANLVALEVQNAAKHVALMEANSFYMDNDYIEAIAGSITDGGTGDSSFVFTVDGARPRAFWPGQRVEVWDSSGSTRRHADAALLSASGSEIAYVDSYNPSSGVTTIRLTTGTFDTQVVATDRIYQMRPASASGADITSSGNKAIKPFNFYNWIKSTGTIYGGEGQPTGFNVTTHGALASITADMSAAPLAEKDLNAKFTAFSDAFDSQIDHVITTHGVLNAYREGRAGLGVEQRQAMESKVRAGFSFFVWTGAGREVEFTTSPVLKSGTLVGMKMRDKNIVRLIPPGLQGTGSDSRFSGRIEFVAPLGNGGKGIWMFSRDNNSNVEAQLQAPFHQSFNIFARDPRGVLLTNLQEQS